MLTLDRLYELKEGYLIQAHRHDAVVQFIDELIRDLQQAEAAAEGETEAEGLPASDNTDYAGVFPRTEE